MKKTHTGTIFQKLVLGIFLGMFLFSGGAFANAVDVCLGHESNKEKCVADSNCHWNERGSECSFKMELCYDINEQYRSDISEGEVPCTNLGCSWTRDPGQCSPRPVFCAKKDVERCFWDSDCRWSSGACKMRAEKQSDKAVKALDGICDCKNGETKGPRRVPVWAEGSDGECKVKQNAYWVEEIPGTCSQPLTSVLVLNFCQMHLDMLTNRGKRKCRNAIGHVMKGDEQKCLDDSEIAFQQGLKDSVAREKRRADDAACRERLSYIYSGPIFEGGGLRSGAILAHENLTKSISHSTDLKGLIIDWTGFILEIVAVIAVIAIIWAGILYITDMGDGSNTEKAKKIIMWVAIGILIILGSYAIVNTLMTADFSPSQAFINTSFFS